MNCENGKFSKSNNTGVFGDDAIESGIPSDEYRFYLMSQRPEKRDTVFSWPIFQTEIKNLINKIGNSIHRVLSLSYKYYRNTDEISVIPRKSIDFDMTYIENNLPDLSDLMHDIIDYTVKYHENMSNTNLRSGLNTIIEMCTAINVFLTNSEPWKMYKVDPDTCKDIMYVLMHVVGLVVRLMSPFVPHSSKNASEYIGRIYDSNNLELHILDGCVMSKPFPLFPEMTDDMVIELNNKFS